MSADGWGYPAGYADETRPGRLSNPGRTTRNGEEAAPASPRIPTGVALGYARTLRQHSKPGSIAWMAAEALAERCMDEMREPMAHTARITRLFGGTR